MQPSLRIPWLKHALPWHPRVPPQSLVPRRIATTSAQNAAPVDLPRLIVARRHKDHNSLATFIDYANRTNLLPSRTFYIGTHYEYTTALSFMRLGFSLLRTGGKNDAGIDLIGHWVLAPLSEPLPIIIQCKARTCSLGPGHVRELEGSFRGIPPDWKKKPVLGLLVTTLKATRGTMDAVARSAWPMGFVMMSKQGLIQQFLWNRAASERGLEGVGVTLRYTPRVLLSEVVDSKCSSKFANTGTQKDIQLTWMGSPIFPGRKTLDQATLDLIDLAVPKPVEPVVDQPKRRPGRPKKAETPVARVKMGRKPTMHLPPAPRGGQVNASAVPLTRKGGRPKGAKNKVKIASDAG